ncbi:unnamed protein product [Phytophthora fragariaefolia]|uniref:Unnamed protein product n=1 Tax=Phytophthora fragariaefolia TaxID=1490495 RepID=A0A9W6Y6I9_9STRA|nr:unnamed protein product [Phytophthora fragariaefolia]
MPVLTSAIFSTSNSPSPSGASQISSGGRASSNSRRSDLSVTSCVSGDLGNGVPTSASTHARSGKSDIQNQRSPVEQSTGQSFRQP